MFLAYSQQIIDSNYLIDQTGEEQSHQTHEHVQRALCNVSFEISISSRLNRCLGTVEYTFEIRYGVATAMLIMRCLLY